MDSKIWRFLEAKVRQFGSWPLTPRHLREIRALLGSDTVRGDGEGI